MSENKGDEPKLLGDYAGRIKFYSNPKVFPPDAAVLGYPDGKGGMKPGYVVIRGLGAAPDATQLDQ